MKTILITGASRGIGKEIAKAVAKKGYNIIINYNKSEKEAFVLEKELASMTGVLTVKANVANMNEVDLMYDKAIKRFNKVDILVNNAGISCCGLFTDISQSQQDSLIDTNIKGVFNATRAVLPDMISLKSGKIVNISSIWGKVGASCEVHYSATKSAIIGFTKALAKEVAPCGINVNCICPGVICTDMLNSFSDFEMESLKEYTPLGRLGTPQDIANAVMFLISEKASFITGQCLTVDGGFIL